VGDGIKREALIDAAGRLGPLPASAHRLSTIVASPDFDFGDVIEVVATDMTLATAVLRAGNSVAQGASTRAESVRDAVVRIGASRTLSIAMMIAVRGVMAAELRGYGLPAGVLWRHSVAASLAGDHIRSWSTVVLPPSLGAASLLHDIGKPILHGLQRPGRTLPDGCAGVTGIELCVVENEVFGASHPSVGALVARHWQLPHAIVEGIRDHHYDLDAELPTAVRLANAVAHRVVPLHHLAAASDDGERGGDAPPVVIDDEAARSTDASAVLAPIVVSGPNADELSMCHVLGLSASRFPDLVTTTAMLLQHVVGRFEPAVPR
jgi:HD-like signal output (HDOD) protein